MALSKTDIVIVNWNAGAQLRECVGSIFAHEGAALGAVIVVDNKSQDCSADFARDDPRIVLVEPGRNVGFGAACNLGAARGNSEYVLFLNPDTLLLGPALESVQSFLAAPQNEHVAVCGVRLVDEEGRTARHCSRQPGPWRLFAVSTGIPQVAPGLVRPLELVEFDHEHDAPVGHVMGAFYFIRRAVFEKLSGFDERFFVYHEDLDLSRRVVQAGHTIRYMASIRVFHRKGGTSRGAKAKALSYLLESRLAFAEKHFGIAGRVLLRLGVYAIEPLRRSVQSALGLSVISQAETLLAMRRLWAMRAGRRVDRD